MSERPIVAVTMGDPAGIGPEVAVKALLREEVWACCRPLIVGDVGVLAQAAKLSEAPVALSVVAALGEARYEPTELDVLDLRPVDITTVRMAEVSATAGRASVAYVAALNPHAGDGGLLGREEIKVPSPPTRFSSEPSEASLTR